MTDATQYFILHLDVHQGRNKFNIDISITPHRLPITQKVVGNDVVKSTLANEKYGSRHFCVDNRHAAPQLFLIMLTNYNFRASGTGKANRVGYDSENLQVSKSSDRGTFICKDNKRLGMVTSRWKGNKTLQTVRIVMKGGILQV